MNSPTTTDSESNITVALVQRVSDRLAGGVPLTLALAGEPATCAEYEEQLRQRPELAAHEGVAKRKFLQNTVKKLMNAKDSSANIRWLLERLYPEVFQGQPPSESVTVNVATAVAGMPAISERPRMTPEYIKLLQEDAKKL
ncbi:MAG TPA: hypothetical protein VMF08_06680 [Candidatus Sulfotelmatobacter sp.]|nr:hypothetical protein [Candidatus Sulfotelmatobacter sp.]